MAVQTVFIYMDFDKTINEMIKKTHCEHLCHQRTCFLNINNHTHSQIYELMNCHHFAVQVPLHNDHHQHRIFSSPMAERLPC